MSSTLIETHFVFVFTLSLPPPALPSPSHPHIDKQPVKVKRKKSFNLSRKFPFYKSKENIVQELVESEREYQLCDRGWFGGVLGFFFFFVLGVFSTLSPSCFSSVYQLSSFRSPPGMVCVMASHSSLSHCPREMPHMRSRHQAGDVGFSLVCLCICLRAPEGCLNCVVPPAVCVYACVLGCINTHSPNTDDATPCISPDQFASQSLTHNKKNLINWTEALTLNRSKSRFNGIGLA